jgi:hypothetical protein
MSGPAGLENPFRKNYYFLMDYDVSKTITVLEISTITGEIVSVISGPNWTLFVICAFF